MILIYIGCYTHPRGYLCLLPEFEIDALRCRLLLPPLNVVWAAFLIAHQGNRDGEKSIHRLYEKNYNISKEKTQDVRKA